MSKAAEVAIAQRTNDHPTAKKDLRIAEGEVELRYRLCTDRVMSASPCLCISPSLTGARQAQSEFG